MNFTCARSIEGGDGAAGPLTSSGSDKRRRGAEGDERATCSRLAHVPRLKVRATSRPLRTHPRLGGESGPGPVTSSGRSRAPDGNGAEGGMRPPDAISAFFRAVWAPCGPDLGPIWARCAPLPPYHALPLFPTVVISLRLPLARQCPFQS
jgi:hypothetical protein